MKCQFFECENEAVFHYPACSSNHGIGIKQNLRMLPEMMDADMQRKLIYRSLISVEQAEHYAKLQT